MKPLLLVGLVLFALAAGCGNHTDLAFDTLAATRGSDDAVSVHATFHCDVVGAPSCKEIGHHCLAVSWYERSALSGVTIKQNERTPLTNLGADFGAATPLLVTESCSDIVLAPDQKESLSVESGMAIPSDRELILDARLTGNNSGHYLNQLEWLTLSP